MTGALLRSFPLTLLVYWFIDFFFGVSGAEAFYLTFFWKKRLGFVKFPVLGISFSYFVASLQFPLSPVSSPALTYNFCWTCRKKILIDEKFGDPYTPAAFPSIILDPLMKVLLGDKIHLYQRKCCLTGNRLKSEVHFHSCIQAWKHLQQALT